ncbi:hypothetical protein BST81_09050 [Leptolyngbya sp. 'hensonii']|uniref:GumC family protein n=1 Tax=Leptolyngbya sp. 'hensonii' TaxID=1922337 RepID=UPI00094FF7CF|nr:polysaccharide biosynthesis tyrosine autokinase [Leptolyngbya sp. 'hensonii']OLP18721.1 hypothetical protein BST81_09050 [Leptolyngbya sp. 'hensonii']
MDEQQQHTLISRDTGKSPRLLSQPDLASFRSGNDDEGGLELGKVVAGLRRRIPLILGVATVVTSAALLKAMTSVPIYQAGFEILTRPVTVEAQVISSLPQTLTSKEEPQQRGVDLATLKLLRSPKLLDPIVKTLKPKYPTLTLDSMLERLLVTPLPEVQILQVAYQDPDPNKVRDILNALKDAYLNYSLEERLADVRQGIKFVDTQIPQLETRVQDLQGKLQTFRQEYNLVDPDAQGQQLSAQLGSFTQERLQTQVKLDEARSLFTDIQQQLAELPPEAVVDSELSTYPRYQKLLDKLLEIDSQIATESSLYLDQSNNIKVLRDQRDNLVPLLSREGQRIQSELASRIRSLEARNQALTDTENFLNLRVKQLSVISRQYTDIQNELKIATDNLNQFLAKREALRIDAGQKQTPWQLLSPPGKPKPSATNAKRAVLLGSILGLLLGVAIALVLDRLDSLIYSPEDVKNATKLPLLGIIPWIPKDEDLGPPARLEWLKQLGKIQLFNNGKTTLEEELFQAYKGSSAMEVFRSIYTSIRLLSPDVPIRSLVITSPDTQDGKSTVSTYLSQAAAGMAQKVLLVDLDLHRPQLHERLGVSNMLGLSDLITNNLDWQQVIQRSSQEENLFVLTAGHLPPDPIRTLSSQKMKGLMEQLEEAFDLVIYDTPPLVGLADTALIAARTDALILVIGLGKSSRSIVGQAMEILKIPPTLVLGAIANGSKDALAIGYGSRRRAFR